MNLTHESVTTGQFRTTCVIWNMCVRLSVTARLHALHTCFSDPLSANCAPALSAPVSLCYFLAASNFCSTTLHGQCEACACALRMSSIIIVCIYVLRAYIAATAVCDCVIRVQWESAFGITWLYTYIVIV